MREKLAPTDTKIKVMEMAREKEVVKEMKEETKMMKAWSTLRLLKRKRSTARLWLSTNKVSEQSTTEQQRSKHVSFDDLFGDS